MANDNRSTRTTTGSGSAISNNTEYNNPGHGIDVRNGYTVNGNSAYSNGIDGIEGGHGLDLSPAAAYRENVISNNTLGTANSGVHMFSNSCDGTTTCP